MITPLQDTKSSSNRSGWFHQNRLVWLLGRCWIGCSPKTWWFKRNAQLLKLKTKDWGERADRALTKLANLLDFDVIAQHNSSQKIDIFNDDSEDEVAVEFGSVRIASTQDSRRKDHYNPLDASIQSEIKKFLKQHPEHYIECEFFIQNRCAKQFFLIIIFKFAVQITSKLLKKIEMVSSLRSGHFNLWAIFWISTGLHLVETVSKNLSVAQTWFQNGRPPVHPSNGRLRRYRLTISRSRTKFCVRPCSTYTIRWAQARNFGKLFALHAKRMISHSSNRFCQSFFLFLLNISLV